jgi:hypothetical protein
MEIVEERIVEIMKLSTSVSGRLYHLIIKNYIFSSVIQVDIQDKIPQANIFITWWMD